jgi:hypothetical protein
MNHVLAATVTILPPKARGSVLICGSHGGRYPGELALLAGVRAAIFNDAGIGLDEAGIASLPLMQGYGVAAAAVLHASCRIGDAEDMLARGVVSRCNAAAQALGLRPGMTCAEAAERLAVAPLRVACLAKPAEARAGWPVPAGSRRIALVDSAALVEPEADRGAIVVTGSHGGLVGGSAAKALKADAFAAFFNDAGIGMEEAGTTRLPALDRRGIAALVIAASSARIGEARSTLVDGVVSRLNETARRLGAREGERALALATRWSRDHPDT